MTHNLPSRDLPREEQVEQIENIIKNFDTVGEYATYTLKCEVPKSNEEIVQRLDEYYNLTDKDSYGPEWTQRLLYADELYYIGQTNDLQRRLLEHTRGTSDSALVTKEFPPIELAGVEWATTRSQAAERELERRRELDDLELTRSLSRDPIPPDAISGRLTGLMEMSAEWYLEDYDPPRKKHVFEEWKENFFQSIEKWDGDVLRAYNDWKETDPIDPPSDPECPLETERELIDYWHHLIECQSEYVDSINVIYHQLLLDESPKPIKVAYSL